MDLKTLSLSLCLVALAITSAEGGLPKCCYRTMGKISQQMLWKVDHWEEQESNGACDGKALVLYVKDRKMPICADPKMEKRLKFIRSMKRKGKMERRARSQRL